jgi:hypothetical protein
MTNPGSGRESVGTKRHSSGERSTLEAFDACRRSSPRDGRAVEGAGLTGGTSAPMRAGNPRLVWKAIHAGHAADALQARSSGGGLVAVDPAWTPLDLALRSQGRSNAYTCSPVRSVVGARYGGMGLRQPEQTGRYRSDGPPADLRVLFCSLELKASLKDLSVAWKVCFLKGTAAALTRSSVLEQGKT